MQKREAKPAAPGGFRVARAARRHACGAEKHRGAADGGAEKIPPCGQAALIGSIMVGSSSATPVRLSCGDTGQECKADSAAHVSAAGPSEP